MKIKEVMTTSPDYISPDTSLKDAAIKMKKNDCGCLPVCDGKRLVGMLTDRDIVIRGVAQGKALTTPVKDVMTKDILYCFEDETLDEASHLMSERQVRRLVVLNKAKKMVGIVALGDLATKCKDHELVADLTESISEAA